MVSDIIYREVTLAAKPMPGDTFTGVLKVYTESANDSALDEIWVPISSSSSDQAMREANRLRIRLGIKSIGAEEPSTLSLSAPKGMSDTPLADFLKGLSTRLAAYKARRSA
jgi:hypothetical protein